MTASPFKGKTKKSKSLPKSALKPMKAQKAPENWIRTPVLIREATHSKVKAIGYWEEKGLKEVVDEALKLFLKGKKIKPLPKKK